MHNLQGKRSNQVLVKVLWLLPITLVIDQASKYLVTRTMSLHDSEPVLGNFFRLTYIHNPGAAFGLNIGSPLVHTIVSIVALSILVYLFWTMPRENRLLRFALTLVLGGALGNIIDRLYLGEVIDFFDFGIATLRWPIFNFADSFVTVGIFLLALGYTRQKESKPADQEIHPQNDQALEN